MGSHCISNSEFIHICSDNGIVQESENWSLGDYGLNHGIRDTEGFAKR